MSGKVLFLEPYSYFERLGVVPKNNYFFGIPFFVADIENYICNFSLVITCIDHSDFSNNAIGLARRNGIKTVLLMDGVFEFSNSINNPYLKKINKKLLLNRMYDSIITPDKYTNEIFDNISKSYYYMPKHSVVKESYRNPPKRSKKFLITTANTAYFDDSEFNILIRLLKEISRVLDNNKIEYSYRIFDEKILKQLSASVINDKESSFDETLQNYHALISTPSTVVCGAILMGMPVCVLSYRDVPLRTASGWVYHEGLNFDKILQSMLDSDKDRMRWQSLLLPNNVVPLNEIIDLLELEKPIKNKAYYFERFIRLISTKSNSINKLIKFIKKI
jgi:hypothetical protein